jgi:hypothetical protein
MRSHLERLPFAILSLTPVLQILYAGVTALKWIFPEEKSAVHAMTEGN